MTILPKKKTGKEKSASEQSNHEHHGASLHSASDSAGSRVRHAEVPLRSSPFSSCITRMRHNTHSTAVSDAPNSCSQLNNYGLQQATEDSPPSTCIGIDSIRPQHSTVDVAASASGNQTLAVCDPLAVRLERPPTAAKRRHGRLSPHSQPYAKGKSSRLPVPTEGVAGCSSIPYHHHTGVYRHHIGIDDKRGVSSPMISSGPPASRNVRRRQRSRAEGKDEKENDGNNSDDEHDSDRLSVLHQGINFEKLEKDFARAMKEDRGFYIKEMTEDGACLFRAVADQVYGDQNMSDEVRRNCMDYMMKNADFFSSFVTEDYVSYIQRKRLPHTHGNHLEMQAMAEMYNRSFEVYQYATEPINTFMSSCNTDNEPIRVSYHRNSHYNSVIDPFKATVGVGLGLPSFRPGLADRTLIESAQRASEQELLEQQMLQDKLLAADWENTEEEMLREVANKSFTEYLRHHESMVKGKGKEKSSDNISATCSRQQQQQPCSSHKVVKNNATAAAATDKDESLRTPSLLTRQQKPDDTSSILPQQDATSLQLYGIPGQGDWVDEAEEKAILAQVLAQSQREYYETLTTNQEPPVAAVPSSSASQEQANVSSSASCSKYPTH